MYHSFTANRPFPSSPGPLYQNEVKRSTFDMRMIFHSQANKTHFHKKGCALGLILKVRVFGTRKWPIRHLINEKGTGADRMRPAIVSGIVTGNAPVSHWPIFFPSVVRVPEVFSKIDSTQFPSRFLTGEFAISTFPVINFICVFLASHANGFAYALFTFLSGRLKVPKEDEDNAYAKLFACFGGQETRKQRVLWEMWQRAVTPAVICVSRRCRLTD